MRAVLAKFCTGKRGERRDELDRAWLEAAGTTIGASTRVASFRGGVIEVEVASAPLLHELVAFRRDALLRRLRELFRHHAIGELRFRAARGPLPPRARN